MEPDVGNSETGRQEDAKEERPNVTRESLYQLVWAESMLKVAARFKVSSSYMASSMYSNERPSHGARILGEVGCREVIK